MNKYNVILIIALLLFIGYIFGLLSMWYGIRKYRKSMGFKPDPFEPENIYLS
jgi:hypothetical protein